MKRLTGRRDGRAYIIGCPDFALPKIAGLIIQQVINRLAAIDDILGDDYELDRLRELMEADKEGRCVVLPCKPGERIWIDGRKAIIEEFFGYETERYFHAQFYDNMQYIDIPFEEISKTIFLTREEAKAALKAREQDD